MRAKKNKFGRHWLDDISWKDLIMARINMGQFEAPGIDSLMDTSGPIENELADREKALMAQGASRRAALNRRAGEPAPRIPYIAGVTDMANASPEMRLEGYLEWVGKSPQQRYEDSALGAMDTMSMEGPSPGRAVLEDMAFGNSYWAGLARNIATGSKLPEAKLPDMDAFEGQKWSDPKHTSPMGEAAMEGSVERLGEVVGGGGVSPQHSQATQRPLDWSELDPETQEKVYRIASEQGISVEEVLMGLRNRGWSGR